jgi:hypothetical protein
MLNPIPMPNFVGSDCDDMKGHPCGGCPCGSGYPGGNTEESFPNREHSSAIHRPSTPPRCRLATSSRSPPQRPCLTSRVGLAWCAIAFGKSNMGKSTAIEDLVRVPKVPPGEYVVGFRWDWCVSSCADRPLPASAFPSRLSDQLSSRSETSSQVWTSCADITIEA